MKLCTAEPGSDEAQAAAQEARSLAASRIAYVETRSAIARGRAAGRLTERDSRHARRRVEQLWADVAAVELSLPLVADAGDLAERHLIRGMDAIHLAAAIRVRGEHAETVVFGTWDDDLRAAATRERFATVPT